jgi:hypothetical protein
MLIIIVFNPSLKNFNYKDFPILRRVSMFSGGPVKFKNLSKNGLSKAE